MVSEPKLDFLPQVKSDEFLPPISRWTTLGGLFLVGTCGAAVTVAAVLKYPITVKAPATIRPAGELRIVQATTEGVVKSIEVKDNQAVRKGDAIATIDDSQLQTQKSQLQGNIQQSKLLLAQINAQISALNTQVLAESNLMNRTITSAQADLSLNQRKYTEQQVTAQTQVQEAEANLMLAKEEMKRYQELANTGAIASLQVKEKEQAFKAALARLKRAKATLNPSTAPVKIATEQIAQERARGESTLATLNKEREELIQRRIEIEKQLNSDFKQLQQTEIELNKSIVKAPETGTILKLELRNPGQVVRPGDPIAQIAPGEAPLVAKARVSSADISKVQVCKLESVLDCKQGLVQLRISAYPYPDYGTLHGAVRVVAPDTITPQSNGANSTSAVTPYYEVTIQPERAYLVRGGSQYPLHPGMEVTADIIAKQETVLTFILRKVRLLTNL